MARKMKASPARIAFVVLNDTILVLQIPIYNKLYPDINYGINLVYTYNSNEINR